MLYPVFLALQKRDWFTTLDKRMQLLCPECPLTPPLASENLFWNIQDKPLAFKMMVIKSVCNSWITSTRFHESVILPCVFGCNFLGPRPPHDHAGDTVYHYLRCPQLWDILAKATQQYIPETPQYRLGLSAMADCSFIVLAHHVYHSIKNKLVTGMG